MIEKRTLITLYLSLIINGLTGCASAQSRDGMSFESFDVDGDSRISQDEFIDKTTGRRRSPEDMFQMLDTDGDGHLTLEEFDARRGKRGGRH